jgi:CHAT domain-containing protein
LGYDTLIVGNQDHSQSFGIIADDAIAIQGEVHSQSIFFKAKDIINQGSITASNITAEFSNSYSDVADAKIIAIDGGSILLNGGKTGDLEATGQFLATGLTGGKIDFRGKTVSLRGANLNASGEKGGGTILIGGDYQGGDSTGLGTLSNAQSVFVDKYSSIKANAITRGNGGKVIFWSDGDTDFRGNITAHGGLKSGDGGFVEVSGKENLNFVGKVDVDATNGKQGTILLDPTDIIINADDGDDSTFDVSDLQKLQGNVTLAATNSITFGTNTYFANSQGTITLQTGGAVSLLGEFVTGGRNLNVSGASIYGMGLISSHTEAGQAGGIRLTSQGEINFGQHGIFANSVAFGGSGTNTVNGGNIVLQANTIVVGALDAGVRGGGNGGNVNVSAKGDIFTSGLFTHSTGNGKSGNIKLFSSGGNINTTNSSFELPDDVYIYASGNDENAGSISLKAFGDIISNGIYAHSRFGNGNTISLLSQTGKIDTKGHRVYSYSNTGNAGRVVLNAYSDIIVGGISSWSESMNAGSIQVVSSEGNIDFGQSSLQANSLQKNAANITLTAKSTEANRSITVGVIIAGSNGDGNGGNVSLSAQGNILTSTITTIAVGNGKGGNVSLKSTMGTIDNTNSSADVTGFEQKRIITYANGFGKAGVVKLIANGDILTGSIQTSSRGGSGNNILITSVNGAIDTNGGTLSSTSFAGGNAGTITLNAAKDIKVGDIFARSRDGEVAPSGVWNGGAVNVTSLGNIETGSITTTSLTGAGGNIKLLASGESIKVINTLKQNDIEYSIISAGATKNGKISIQQTGKTDNYFEVGDATYNGTKGGIYAGVNANGVENSLLGTTIVVGTHIDGNIKIVTPDNSAGLSKAKQLAPEKATLPTTFNPVALSEIQKFIDNGNSAQGSITAQREYSKAIVALDNFRTLEFYQNHGVTSPPVPQLNSVNQIKTFLNAGDIAANTKSAMIYTFLSGTTQDNPSGTSLNLFAVTSASDIIYRTIPLINKDLGSIVADFRAGVQGLDYDYESSGSNLYDLIIRPLKATLDLSQVNNLVFSTDNLFRTIPLAALYDKQTSNFLVEDFSSSIAPSFQVIEKDKYTSLKSANVLKMGATVFGSQRPLPSVRTELENIAQIELQNSPNIRHSPIYLNDQFSDGILKKSIAKNDAPIIHLATHGDISNSGGFVFLGSNNSSGQSDRLNASDIRQLRDLSNKDLLVFSTCLSFTGFNYSTAGAALVAGVKSVIGCRWIVSDSATMVAMTGFYQELLSNGLSKTKALQEAQKSMLLGNVKVTDVAGTTDRAELSIKEAKVISSEYGQKDIKAKVYSAVDPNLNYLKHPFYWAAFSLIGNPW